ncbi:MAG TPA: ATP-binding cassette domain-containing protein [Jiangellaceae bacterium]|nr:ATP-binding cassette domain-containing protein [Jiangellaceae bacterium]
MTARSAIRAEGLVKRYGDNHALDGLSLDVPAGTVLGLLGPNGAGKTTTVRILATLLHFDAGRVEVAGFDVTRNAQQVRSRIGLAGQSAAVDEVLSGKQNLDIFGRLYHLGARDARRRADQLLDQFGLTDAADRPAGTYSGGMRRRLDLAASLILDPQVLFLDEPTTGLDPRSRNEVWRAVRDLVENGTTVLLTTQYLEEADRLADTIVVIDSGRAIAEGAPDQLKAQVGADQIVVAVRAAADLETTAGIVARVTDTAPHVDREALQVSAPVRERVDAMTSVLRLLTEAEVVIDDVGIRQPTLDDVFLQLTDDHAPTTQESAA